MSDSLQTECDHLRNRIAELEQELAMARLERDGYAEFLRMLTPRNGIDWQRVIEDNDCKTLDEFRDELDAIIDQ